jgi:anti-anti-sigma factor
MTEEHEPKASNPPTIDARWPQAGVAHVILGGEHDLDSADRLSIVLTEMLEGGSHLIVDLGATRFIDSSTIQVLLATKGRADAGRRRFNLLLGTEPIVERVLEITGVLILLNRVHTLEEALGEPAASEM